MPQSPQAPFRVRTLETPSQSERYTLPSSLQVQVWENPTQTGREPPAAPAPPARPVQRLPPTR